MQLIWASGRALKTGFNYFLNNYKDKIGIITLDSDGQHTASDVEKIYIKMKENPNSLITGARSFNDENVPLKSKMGNKLTRTIFNFLIGTKLTDTQTGLRGIPTELVYDLLNVPGERYEFETNMLISVSQKGIKIVEETINTIYEQKNKKSHFNPLIDSVKIYLIFFKYILSSIIAFVVDILLYKLLFNIFINIINIYAIMIATVLARVASSVLNYNINKNIVFKKMNKTSIIKYFTLCIIQMFVSGGTVSLLYWLTGFNEVGLKIIVDLVIFFINYKVQQKWVFKKEAN